MLELGAEERPIRVLHCPMIVGGNAGGLAAAERDIGLASWSVSLEPSPFAYRVDELLRLPHESRFRRELRRFGLLRRAIAKYDVIHFNFGLSLMPVPLGEPPDVKRRLYQLYARALAYRDLPLLKRLGKGIVVTYQGDDARQQDYCLEHFDITFAHDDVAFAGLMSDEAKRDAISHFDRSADRIYALNPDLLHILPTRAEFLPYAHIHLDEWQLVPHPQNDVPVLLHAPSNRTVKGSSYVFDAVERLRSDGIDFEFVLVENMSQADARRAYERADLAVDQLLAGWYGALAVELMALGRPVVAYIRDDDLGYLPHEMRDDLPVINATPTSIYETLQSLLTDRKRELPGLGIRSRRYVERWHDPHKVAGRLAKEYRAIVMSPRSTSPRSNRRS